MSAVDEARLRELADAVKSRSAWRLSRTRRYVMDGWGAPWVCEVTQRPGWEDTAAFLEAAQPATILALLNALSAERERADRAVGLLREMTETVRFMDDAGPHYETYQSDEFEALIKRSDAFLATQKAEGAET